MANSTLHDLMSHSNPILLVYGSRMCKSVVHI